jgi:pimeloyl-ACP methyl ester carboxylesterase
MSASRPSAFVVLTLVLTALFSSFAWSEDRAPHTFRVEVSGHGRPMILIPGLASSGDTWKSTVARYRDRYECHVLTLAGFAGVPPIEEPLMTAVRAELATYIRDRKLDHPTIVGHSLGGSLALAVAVDHPDLVGPLVIVDEVPFLGGTVLQATSPDEARPQIAAMRSYMSAMTDRQWTEYAKSGESVKYMVTAPSDLATLTQWSVASDRKTVTEALADVYALDLREAVAKIRTPVLVLGTWKGIRDQVLAAAKFDIPRPLFLDTFAAQYAGLPRLHFVLSDAARHFIMFDDPAGYFEQLDAFLRDPDAAVKVRGLDGK